MRRTNNIEKIYSLEPWYVNTLVKVMMFFHGTDTLLSSSALDDQCISLFEEFSKDPEPIVS
ncbi:hypothetical protein HanPSC8_Chr06g0256981 [Helianthus annuus]|nr:hypothetical protein HanPSC8_Chr06g0256981 [Helianthus annuus]